FLQEAKEKNLRPHFIEVPAAIGPESVCFGKLRNHSEGNFKATCLRESLNLWDHDRNKVYGEGYIWESCCSMYDAIDCMEAQAKRYCTAEEATQVASYRSVSATAFSQGICRAIPY